MTSLSKNMFATHFGSSISGAVVWWDNETDPTKLSCYLTLNMYANPLIVDSGIKSGYTCTADDKFLKCDTTALGATTAATSSVVTTPTFDFGIVWQNYDSTASVQYDGLATSASLKIIAPSSWITGYYTVKALSLN